MNALRRAWDHFEEGFIAFLLAAMTRYPLYGCA